jgi:AmmeMemoRadiSam system protein B/AmmeMemoRadiSam system protein A
MSTQPAAVAGHFYPAVPEELAAGVDGSLARATPLPLAPKAVIAPHAGHIYSGDIAGSAYRLLSRRKGEIRRAILLGPNHRVPLRGLAISPADAWETPLGSLPVDHAGRAALARLPFVAVTHAPFASEHSLEVHLPFVHRALGEVEILPILVGQAGADQVSAALDLVWGGAETAIIVSSDLSHFHDYATCCTRDSETAQAIERLQPGLIDPYAACGSFAIHGLLHQAQRRDLRVTAVDVRNSGDTRGGRDRVVGYGAFTFEYAEAARLDAGTRRTLLKLTRDVIGHGTANPGQGVRVTPKGEISRLLRAQRATFVTIRIGDELRGCRGSLRPERSLLADVVKNARGAAFSDPRFAPLTAEERDRINLHISILSTPRRMPVTSELDLARALRPGLDGLILKESERAGTFLPAVWESIPDPLNFVRHLQVKAGLPVGYWSDTIEAYRFTTESFGDPVGHA